MTDARQRVVAIVTILIVIGATAGMVRAYAAESDSRSVTIEVGNGKAPDHVNVKARLVSIDPLREEATFRLDLEPKGALVGADGITTAKELRLIVNAATGSAERSFTKGRVMSAQDVVVDLRNGVVSDYPFDSYDAVLEMALVEPTATGTTPEPLEVIVDASVHGWKFDPAEETRHATGYALVHVAVSRSPATVAVAIAMMALYWLLGISAGVLTWGIAMGGRKLEPPLLIWAAGLLFALVAFRGAMPASPSIGAFVDYAAFFPVESGIAVCAVVLVGTYVRRLGMS